MNIAKLVGAATALSTAWLVASCFSIKTTSKGAAPQQQPVQNITQVANIKDIHPWAKKRVAYFGDSVSDPAVAATKTRYWDYLRDWLGITPYVYAVNGREWNDIPRQTDELQKEHGQEVDAIVVFAGTNDFNAGVPIGKFFNESDGKVVAATGEPKSEKQRRHREPVMDAGTFCGRLNIGISKIKTLYPTKQLVLLTPLHRAFATFGDNNVQPDENWQNSRGEWVDAYIEAVRQAGRVWAVPVVDVSTLSGLYPVLDSNAQFFANASTDRLHPNESGHRRIATTMVYQLLTIPCTFENP